MQPMQSLNSWSSNILYNKMDEINYYVKKYNQIGFVVLGDSHLICTKVENNQYNLDSNGQQYKKILNHIVNNKKINPMFIIHGGDIVNAGDKAESFAAFAQVTKNMLENTNTPIFISIGNHDYNRYKVSSENFKFYIGPVRGVIEIPGTYIKYIYLNTHYSDAPMNRYIAGFGRRDLELLLNERKVPNNKYHYIIDFHTPLAADSLYLRLNHHQLSYQETSEFINVVKELNVIGIFCHHKHIAHVSKINLYNHRKAIPYIISGCGGNHNNNQDFSYYYITIDTNHYKITSCTKYLVL